MDSAPSTGQWIIPDSRVINQPNPKLWEIRSGHQVYLTALARTSPKNGPALTVTGAIPDLDHYNGRGGRIFPLWADASASISNVRPKLLSFLSSRWEKEVGPDALAAYVVAVAAHPAFTKRFRTDLATPELHIPLTADRSIFEDAVRIGRRVIWLQTFGDRMVDPSDGRPGGPPRMPHDRAPTIPKDGAVPQDESGMPDSIDYDASKKRLLVGKGFVENIESAVWKYEVSGKQVLIQWFSYRKKNRERPIIGDRRPPSPLGDIQPECWLAEYTTELINVLNVLGLLVELEPMQRELLERVCTGPTLSNGEIQTAGVFELPSQMSRSSRQRKGQIGKGKQSHRKA